MGRPGSGDVDALTNSPSTGTVVPYKQTDKGVTLGIGTYYFMMGTQDAVLNSQAVMSSCHVAWAAAVAGLITLETCNFPATIGGATTNQGGVDVGDSDTTVGNWIQENPSTAIVSTAGSGNSSTAATVTMGGSAIGGCTYQLGNISTKRARLKVVTTVGGIVRCNVHGKGGSAR